MNKRVLSTIVDSTFGAFRTSFGVALIVLLAGLFFWRGGMTSAQQGASENGVRWAQSYSQDRPQLTMAEAPDVQTNSNSPVRMTRQSRGTVLATEELKTDDGSMEESAGGEVLIVNRLTPSATSVLQTVRIFLLPFPGQPNPSGKTIRIIAFTGSSNSTQAPANPTLVLDRTLTVPTVPGEGGLVDFPITNGPTINLGQDLYVGYKTSPANGVFAFGDSNGPQQQRAYFSTDNGATYGRVVFVSQQGTQIPINLGIRAVVDTAAAPTPSAASIDVQPTSLDFGVINANTFIERSLTIRNTGGSPLNITNITSNNARFTVTSQTNFTVMPTTQQNVTVRFTANAAGVQTGTFSIASNDPARPSVSVTLRGEVSTTPVSCFTVSGISPALGNVGSSVTISGSNLIGVDDVIFSGNAAAGFSVSEHTRLTVTVPVGAVTGPITIRRSGCADIQTESFNVCPNAATVALVDDGTFEDQLGPFPNAVTSLWVNRLTPSGYPATLSAVTAAINLPVGTGVDIVVGSNADGDIDINNIPFQFVSTTVGAQNQLFNYSVPPLTITSGDFVVGFRYVPNATTFPAALDKTVPRGRSYFSGDGAKFITLSDQFAGNLGIRARAFLSCVGGGFCSYAISPSGKTIPESGGTDIVTVTAGAGCLWTATSNVNWLNITAGASGIGNGSVTYSVTANTGPQRTGTLTIAGRTFTVTQAAAPQTPRKLRIVSSTGFRGAMVEVPVDLISLGDENTVAFSLNFDPAIFNSPIAQLGTDTPATATLITNDNQASQGRFGVQLLLPAAQAFSTGSRRIILIKLTVAPNSNATSTNVSFGDQPIGRVVGDRQAAALPVGYETGSVTILPGWEADVEPRPGGKNNGTVNALDAARIGRFSAGLDTANNGSEFQRADCAPRSAKGDGRIDALDWAQAARYAALLDEVQTADGPTTPQTSFENQEVIAGFSASSEQGRVVRVVSASTMPGTQVVVPIRIDALGNESVFSFSLNFDPTMLGAPTVSLATGILNSSQLQVNTLQAAQGRIGIVLILQAGTGLSAGSRDLVNVTFNVSANGAGVAPISFGNQPVARLVGDKDLNDLTATTTFTNGTVTIGGQPNPVPSISGLNPNSVAAGSIGFVLTVNGSNFVSGTTVNWNGNARATTFVSATQVTANISAADIVTAGIINITVSNQSPGGGTSNTVQLTITQQQTTARTLRVASSSGSPGSVVTVPIELVAQGDENAIGFSIAFDPVVLSNPMVMAGSDAANASLNANFSQSTQGRLGVLLALSAGQVFTAGVRQVVKVTFAISASANITTTQINFSDQPIAREISSVNAAILPVNYSGGALAITQGYEADVAPRPNGSNNGTVTVTDWVQVGRFVAGLDVATSGSEFQRADTAPKEFFGDGRLSVSDLTQAGRYAAGLDPVVAAGGPTNPSVSLNVADQQGPAETEQSIRKVRVVEANVERGQSGSVAIFLDAMGGENALSFSLSFDVAQLRFLSAVTGKDAANATLAINTAATANGRIGIVLALPGGQSFTAGVRELLMVNFTAPTIGNPEMSAISFGDLPILREMADLNARILPASFTDGVVKITRTVANVSSASYSGANLAAETITSAFGSNLATAVQVASVVPLPTQLAGTTVKVKDSAGTERLAPLFFVAPTQVNYLIPPGTAAGAATITITSGDGSISNGEVAISSVGPGLFTANASGQGIAAATVFRVKADGSQIYEAVSRFDPAQGKVVPAPIDLSLAGDQVFLLLFGTGCKGRSSLVSVQSEIGGLPVETLYVGPQGDFVGLDQINLRLPNNLAGRGEVQIKLLIDGKAANVVTVVVK